MKYLGYVRASTGKQTITLEAQQTQLRAWAAASDHDIEFRVEAEKSGGLPPAKRPVLCALLDDLDAKKADGLVAVKLDRVSRSTRDVLDLVERARRGGWALVSKQESLDTSSATGRFIVTVFAALAEMERGLVGERTSACLAELKKSGRRFSGHAPWGWQNDEVHAYLLNGKKVTPLVPCPTEREISASVARLPTHSSADIASRCNQEHGPHPRTGKPWKASDVASIRRALKREAKKKVE